MNTNEFEEINLIASGYDWICPNCDLDNRVIHLQEIVVCHKCNKKYKTDDNPSHATG